MRSNGKNPWANEGEKGMGFDQLSGSGLGIQLTAEGLNFNSLGHTTHGSNDWGGLISHGESCFISSRFGQVK